MESVSLMFIGDLLNTKLASKDDLKLLTTYLPFKLFTTKLLFVASQNEYKAAKFHAAVDKHKNTITLIKSESGNVFGGFTPLEWKSDSNYANDEKKESFVFSITHKSKHQLFQNIIYAIYNNPAYGPTFGGGHDIYVSNDCHTNLSSYSNFGYCYKSLDSVPYGSVSAQTYLAGVYNFKVADYEVYEISPIIRED